MKKQKLEKKVVKVNGGLSVINPHAAGIDIGDTVHYIAISDGKGGHKVLNISAFTCDLKEIVAFLKDEGVTTVAMESTGVYWLSLYLMLEEAGIEPYLVNARHVKNVTGRKKDDSDAVWIQKLHSCGLLQKSFQPDNEMRTLRDYTRQRKNLISLSSDAVRRMQKALELMNIKIHTVISDILGKTGMNMVRAILAGERDANVLATLTDARIKASKEDIIKSLEGIWKEEYLFLLKQAFETYEFHQKQIKDCEAKIQQQLLKQVAIAKDGDITELEANKKLETKVRSKKNDFGFSLNPYLISLTGVDLCKIPGINVVTALEFISEVGIDMTKWKSSKHFAAWLNLSPNVKISGGQVLNNKMMKKKNIAGQCLKQGAFCLSTNKTAIGDYYRIKRSKYGGKGAVLCTAHKLARIIYTMLLKGVEYNPEMLAENNEKFKQAKIRNLEKRIEKLKKTG